MLRHPSDEKLRQELQRDLQEQLDKEIHNKSSEHDTRLKEVSALHFALSISTLL